MRKCVLLIAILVMFSFVARNVHSAPTVELLPTTHSVEKGSKFEIRVKIVTMEPISNVVIVPIVPEGFEVEPLTFHGVEMIQVDGKDKTVIKIPSLDERSAITIPVKIKTPGYLDSPRKRSGEFAFNVFFTGQKDSARVGGSLTSSISIRYTTSIGFYILAGLLGIILGHIVKIGNQNRKVITEAMQAETSIIRKLRIIAVYIFVSNMPALLTLLAVGFGVLLVLAKESVPVIGWPQATGLGVGLAILADEQLLMKIQSKPG
jgi:hypothetical protein